MPNRAPRSLASDALTVVLPGPADGEWLCRNCGQTNLGTAQRCTYCGQPPPTTAPGLALDLRVKAASHGGMHFGHARFAGRCGDRRWCR